MEKKVYTRKCDKALDNWMFHEDYFTDETNFLPKSIQKELAIRLTKCVRNPIPVEELKELNPIIEVKLKNICDSYKNKQNRSRLASQNKRINKPDTNNAAAEESSSDESESDDEGDIHADFNKFIADFRRKNRFHCGLGRKAPLL